MDLHVIAVSHTHAWTHTYKRARALTHSHIHESAIDFPRDALSGRRAHSHHVRGARILGFSSARNHSSWHNVGIVGKEKKGREKGSGWNRPYGFTGKSWGTTSSSIDGLKKKETRQRLNCASRTQSRARSPLTCEGSRGRRARRAASGTNFRGLTFERVVAQRLGRLA